MTSDAAKPQPTLDQEAIAALYRRHAHNIERGHLPVPAVATLIELYPDGNYAVFMLPSCDSNSHAQLARLTSAQLGLATVLKAIALTSNN
jgi:hypothetical protein